MQATTLVEELLGKALTQVSVGLGDLQMHFAGGFVVSIEGDARFESSTELLDSAPDPE